MTTEHDLIIIKGKRGSGKTRLAKELVFGKNALWTRPEHFLTTVKCITENTEYLVIDEVESEKAIDSLLPFLSKKTITMVSWDQGTQIIKLPTIIICLLIDHRKLLNLDGMNILVKTADLITLRQQ